MEMKILKIDNKSGFTILEALITTVIIMILMGVGAPSIGIWIDDSRVKAAALDLTSDIYVARNSALKLNCDVKLTPVSSSDWAKGWEVSYQAIETGASDPSDNDAGCAATGGDKVVLKTQQSYDYLRITGPAVANIVFGFDGRVATGSSSDVLFDVRPKPGSMAAARCIRLSPSGKPNTVKKESDVPC